MNTWKDSGIEWIGSIPSDWCIHPAKYSFVELRTKNTDGNITKALKFFNGNIIEKENFDAESDDYVAETITSYTIVEPDTIMINGLNLNYDLKSQRVGLVKNKGVITSAYLALRPDSNKILPNYATYLFKGYEAKMAFHNMGSGIRKTLGFKEFKNQPVLYPPIKEQLRIVNFLDQQCSIIERIIDRNKLSIEEYKKLKQAVITQAITKGLHGDRVLKDSGNKFIGNIADNRMLTKVKYVASRVTDGAHISPEYDENGYDYISTVNIDNGIICFENCLKTSPESYYTFVNTGCQPHKNDILISKDGSVGKTAIVPFEKEFVVGSSLVIISPIVEKILPEYLDYNLQSSFVQNILLMIMHGTALKRVSVEKNANLPILLIDIDEQKEIVNYLNHKCSEIDELISNKEKLLYELESYKKSMIYEYVTGKKEA